jgi:hypothetical protein
MYPILCLYKRFLASINALNKTIFIITPSLYLSIYISLNTEIGANGGINQSIEFNILDKKLPYGKYQSAKLFCITIKNMEIIQNHFWKQKGLLYLAVGLFIWQ